MQYPFPSRVILALAITLTANAALGQGTQPTPPQITRFGISGGQAVLKFTPFPATEEYKILSAPTPFGPFLPNVSGAVSSFGWTNSIFGPSGFFLVQPKPMDSNQLASAIILNRLTYGQTPDELDRIRAIGPDAYIAEQLAPEKIEENLPVDVPSQYAATAQWQYVTKSGTPADTETNLYVYLNVPGEGYIDDLKLVAGSVAGSGANLIRNGDFESPLTGADWHVSPNLGQSRISTEFAHSGKASLHLVATQGGTSRDSSIWQNIVGPFNGGYTLSYWFLPVTNKFSSLTVRLTGSKITTSLNPVNIAAKLYHNSGSIDDLRQWYVTHAVRAKRQLLEVLLQFLENHFVTQYSKSADYMDRYYNDGNQNDLFATAFEYNENTLWRQALLNPNCTFYDLLKISAESPAMIIYLDTVDSRGDGSNIANENYARELLELFTFGVDNGYDQTDIVTMSRAWTGWTVDYMDPTNQFNPLAVSLRTQYGSTAALTNYAGVWSFRYNSSRHGNQAKVIFPGKTVPDRFGPPYAGRSYELTLPAYIGSPNGGTNGIKDGYGVISHLANQPFTQEFISVKLCRLFVHDDFATGYDFTDPNLSPEGKLVRACMSAWENSSPKGQIRPVLATIFNSELFRKAARHKVKTPLEFTASVVRALSAQTGPDAYTTTIDGNFAEALGRMGNMQLFDRAEPDGYPESGPPWISAGTLAERIRWVQSFLQRVSRSGDAGSGNLGDPVALIKLKLSAADQRDATAVANYFVSILYPAEGRANLDDYRTAAVNFLNTADNGTSVSLFSSLGITTTQYNDRVRGMVAMLMTLPRFQEQ